MGSSNDGGSTHVTSFAFPLTGFVTVLSVLVTFWTSFLVARARAKFQVPAPATTGPDDFQRVMRIQMNTVEQIVIFMPMLWLFAALAGDGWAALAGILWPIGRVLYAQGYAAAAEKRSRGFGVTIVSTALLTFGSLILLIIRAL